MADRNGRRWSSKHVLKRAKPYRDPILGMAARGEMNRIRKIHQARFGTKKGSFDFGKVI